MEAVWQPKDTVDEFPFDELLGFRAKDTFLKSTKGENNGFANNVFGLPHRDRDVTNLWLTAGNDKFRTPPVSLGFSSSLVEAKCL
jgi:hypothetical protein